MTKSMETRIVVVDNDKSIQVLVTASLQEKGWQVFAYDYAQINLAVIAQQYPDLIVLDFDFDFDFENVGIGWEFLQFLKMDDATANIPILITTTAFQLPTEVRDYLLTRHISVVHKSYDLDTFMTLVDKTLTNASQSDVIFSDDRTLPILVVDDTEDLRDVTTTILRLEGYRVVSAENGLVALDTVSHADYCLILLDIDMPVMNGFEFLKAYEQQLRPHSPVIIFSGEDNIQSRILPSFVVDVLAKPFTISSLLDLVQRYAEPEAI